MSFNFGGTSATTKPAFGFGTTALTASAPVTGSTSGFSFGSAPPAGAAKPTATLSSGFSFGGTPSSTAAGGFGAAAATTTSASAFGFGTTSTAKPAFGGFSGPAAITTASGFGAFGSAPGSASFGQPKPAAPSVGGFGASVAPVAPAGLGGSSTASAGLGGSLATPGLTGSNLPSGQHQGEPVKPGKDGKWKDSNIPPELSQDVDAFRKHVKEQKSVSTDMSHLSLPKLHQKIQDDVDSLNAVVKRLEAGVARQKSQLEKVKKECAKELVNVEVAQRTKDTPAALQYENNSGPVEYFHRLIANFESQMTVYRRQIEDVENYLQTLGNDSVSSPETLIKAIQQTQSAFVSLAGRYQPLHEAIQHQKGIYVQQHRLKHGTADDPFKKKPAVRSKNPGSSVIGPSPFTGKPDPLSLAKAAQQSMGGQTPQINPQGPPAMGLGSNASSFGFGNTSAFGAGNVSMFGSNTSTSVAKPAFGSFGAGTNTGAFGFNQTTSTTTPGLLGTTMSPFGAAQPQSQPQGQSSFLFAGGKRGKH